MPEEPIEVRCFQLTLFLSTDNPFVGATFTAAAGDNHDEVVRQPPRFQTSELRRAKTVCEQLLEKLGKAVKDGAETIEIHVDDAGIIVPDPEPVVMAAPFIPKRTPKFKAAFKASPKKAMASAKKTTRIKKKTEDKKKVEVKKKAQPKKQTEDKKKTTVKKQAETKKKASPGRKNKKPARKA